MRGRVLRWPSSAYSRGSRRAAETWLPGSATLPKVIARVGQAPWQAVSTAPSGIGACASLAEVIRAAVIRWMQ